MPLNKNPPTARCLTEKSTYCEVLFQKKSTNCNPSTLRWVFGSTFTLQFVDFSNYFAEDIRFTLNRFFSTWIHIRKGLSYSWQSKPHKLCAASEKTLKSAARRFLKERARGRASRVGAHQDLTMNNPQAHLTSARSPTARGPRPLAAGPASAPARPAANEPGADPPGAAARRCETRRDARVRVGKKRRNIGRRALSGKTRAFASSNERGKGLQPRGDETFSCGAAAGPVAMATTMNPISPDMQPIGS